MNIKETEVFLKKINKLFCDIENLNVPTLASINGAALGGGLELALCCDFRIASENSILGLTETSLGIIPGAGGIFRLSKLIGLSKAKYWIYTARKFKATEAFEYNFVNFITTVDNLENYLQALNNVVLLISSEYKKLD